MSCCERATGRVVPDDPRHRGDRRRMDVDEHDRDRRAHQERDGRVERRQRHHEQSVGPLRLGQGAQVVIALLDRLDVVDDEVELAVRQHRVDAAEAFGGLRPGQERHDHADGQRPTETEPPRRRARCEPELPHHRQDPLTGLWVDHVHPVQRPRRRRDAHPRVAGDIADGDGLLGHGCLICNRLHETGYNTVSATSRCPVARVWPGARRCSIEQRSVMAGTRGSRTHRAAPSAAPLVLKTRGPTGTRPLPRRW